MKRIGVICGMASEAACLAVLPEDSRPPVRCAGASMARAREGALALARQGVDGLISFGTAGGLAPGLKAGSVVIADRVINTGGGRNHQTDHSWRQGIFRALAQEMDVRVAPIACTLDAVSTKDDKRRLHLSSGAFAVDMESQGVGEAARKAGVPFMAVRVIADSHLRRVPKWLTGCIDEDGRVNTAAVIGGLIIRPFDIKAVLVLSGDAGDALIALRRVATLAGPDFGLG
ncbi:MAG: hypothetical protein V3R66_02080 [Rhodospirillales bacterium]